VGYYDDEFRITAPAVTVTGRGDVGYAQARNVNFTPVVRLLALKTKQNCDFIENAINRKNVIVESTGVPQLTVPQLENFIIEITSIDEQSKIGAFFSKLDNLITLHQRKYFLFSINLQEKKRRFILC
jgi:type I restriction enzyme S subunit